MYVNFLNQFIKKGQLNNCLKASKIYHIMNKMEYSKILPELDIDDFAKKFQLEIDNKIFINGAYVFKKDNKIEAIYDYVNQTLFTDNREYLNF
jgi:hypothetical protein